jgi:exosortase
VYLLYSRRHELLSARRRTCLWGLPLLILACVFQILGYWVHNPWSCQVGMTVLLFGLVLYLGGGELAKVTWLPIFFLVFAMPIPEIVYREIAYPLQKLAAHGSAAILKVFGVMIRATESSLQIISRSGKLYTPTVADACSGMRLLMAFLALGVAMAYLEDRPLWQRVVLVLLGIPVAIACNVIRVAITCGMYVLDRPEMGKDFMHEFTGMLMLVPAFGLLWVAGWFMQNIFVEVEEEGTGGQSGRSEATT